MNGRKFLGEDGGGKGYQADLKNNEILCPDFDCVINSHSIQILCLDDRCKIQNAMECHGTTVLYIQGWCPNDHQHDEGKDLSKRTFPYQFSTPRFNVKFQSKCHKGKTSEIHVTFQTLMDIGTQGCMWRNNPNLPMYVSFFRNSYVYRKKY